MSSYCQTVSNLPLGNFTLEEATLCFSPESDNVGTMTVTVKFAGYTVFQHTFPVVTTIPYYEGTNAGTVILQFGNPVSTGALDLVLNMAEDVGNLANALGYPGVFNIYNVYIDQDGDLVFSYSATSLAQILVLGIIFIIALAVLIWIGGQSVSAVLNSISGTSPSPPNCQDLTQEQCSQQYQLYYESYQKYLQNKTPLSISSSAIALMIAAGLGLLVYVGYQSSKPKVEVVEQK
mgnify:CR=1 FL=1